jgi:hypothetical protein
MCGPEDNPRLRAGRHRQDNQSYRPLTGRNLFLVATRHFVPGYLHLVPSGQQTVSTCPLFRSHITPHEHLQPATRVQFELGEILLHSNTPSLRVAGFEDEDDDEDEYEAPGEQSRVFSTRRRTEPGRFSVRQFLYCRTVNSANPFAQDHFGRGSDRTWTAVFRMFGWTL